MKNCIYCLSVLTLINLVACTGTEISETSKQTQTETIDPATRLGAVKGDVADASIDSVLAVEVAEAEKAAHLAGSIERTKILKEAYDKGEAVSENYVESIPFTTFIKKPVELGALEVIQLKEQYTRVYADYFDGKPIGGKLFFIQNDTLIAIEIIQLRERITENGASIQDESTHIVYYHEEELLSIVNLSTNEVLDETSIDWLDENLADWKLVKKHLNTL